MRALLLSFAVGFAAFSSAALARGPMVPCDVAAKLEYTTYLPIATANLGGWSEAAEDGAAEHFAVCREKALTASLAKSPSLRARIAQLRTLLRQLRARETTLAVMMSGGGTRYTHESIRSWVDIEHFLGSLAALASDTYGGLNASRGAADLRASDAALAARVRKLRAKQPTETLGMLRLGLNDWRKAIDEYEKTYKAIVAVVGRKPDIATVAAHGFISRPLFLDEKLAD